MRLRAGLLAALFSLLLAGSAEGAPRATSISAGPGITCATLAGGSVECWGRDYVGGTINHRPAPVAGITEAVAVSEGIHYTCALLRSHRVMCWGDDGYGQLGDGSTSDSPTPVPVQGISNAIAISAGGYHACALLQGGGAACWGRNLHGALGDGSRANSSIPVAVRGLTGASKIYAGTMQEETCALLESGLVRCWGFNGTGQLGMPRAGDLVAPATVPSITGARDIATSGGHTCAVLTNGQVKCWGKNSSGQLGDGTLTDSIAPVTVRGLRRASAVAVDPLGYSCAVLRTGAVYCWGHNPKNQLGDRRFPAGSAVPVRAVGVAHAVAITTAVGHACALLRSGAAECWGYDDYGQLGDGARPPLVRDATRVAF
ncbi:MAG TPA: hypothetical protein VFW29_12670 [Solirubrobacteraceae bacterium]|nr:hypothetical protein [Solirubrobacteraceae bacterium]